ncbi:hypothetical protein GUJ93_ZPchr0010g8811 [Zizania palustris]|uniref:Uncharacterized protein n=1 Tax=Zizania palustris TaxID=103762 RepID=A0A8J6BMP9_ZIZPA|nr:hypothetical protein GUJ93_ZPchr0010g8811 [Zizania palustris]
MKKTTRSTKIILDDEEEDDEVQEVEVNQNQQASSKASVASSSIPSSGTMAKRKAAALSFTPVAKRMTMRTQGDLCKAIGSEATKNQKPS